MGKRGPKRNAHQKARDFKKEAALRGEGKTLQEIGDVVGLTREQVRLDLKIIDQALLSDAKADLEVLKAQMIAKVRHAQIESLKAWARSLEDAVKNTSKRTEKGFEESETIEGQSGNTGHINNYIKAVEAEAKILGIYDLGSGKGDEAADRLLDLHRILEEQRKSYTHDTQKPTSSQS